MKPDLLMCPCNPSTRRDETGEQGSDASLAGKGVGGGDMYRSLVLALSYSDLKSNELKIGLESYLCCLVLFSVCLFEKWSRIKKTVPQTSTWEKLRTDPIFTLKSLKISEEAASGRFSSLRTWLT